ncbi:MAG: restriction endonuclease subunit S [Desulfurivibrionaceae bacterium]|nr:restriction endonuclease subunit S [Desulfurivibrionaceae bacterium]
MKAGWVIKKLEDVCDIERGGSPRPIDNFITDAPDGINWIKIGDTKNVTKYIYGTEQKIKPEGAKRSRMVFEGDFILSNSMSFGRPYIMKTTGCIHDGWLVLRKPNVDHNYLYYVLGSDLVFSQFYRLSAGSTVRNLNIGLVKGVEIPVPSLPEQQRIVTILDEAFDGIATAKANAEKNLQNARALFESHLQSVFTQRGEGWKEEPVSSFCDVKHGFAFDGAEFSTDVPEGNPLVITPGNFTEDGKLLFNEKNTKRFSGEPSAAFLFDVGDLAVVMTDLSSKMKILGKPAFVETDNVLHNQRIGRVVFVNDRIKRRFLYYYMMSEGFLKNIKNSATGTMVKHTAPKRILSNVIPYPIDRKKQQAVISKIDSLRTETQRLESIYQQKFAALDTLKKSLLDQAFTGQL